MSEVRRLFVLLCGYEVLPKGVSVRGAGARFILAEPVCAYLLDTAQGWVLLDTGMDPDYANDPDLRARHFLDNSYAPPVVREAHGIDRQLADIGIGIGDISRVILSHLHYDHCGRLDRFVHASVAIQRREHAYAFGTPGAGYIRRDYDHPAIAWDLRDGDWQALPGLTLLDTRGHTEGHQSALVDLPSGRRILLPFDAGDLAENFADEVLPGESCDDDAALNAIRRLNQLAAEPGTEMLLFHDPVAIQAVRLAPHCYD